ncbi:MAG: pseudouridine-5'-phosphate glycosidase, partial [Pyrinomonadaceae bacterium]
KISKKDLPICIARKQNGATTVSATSFIAYQAGIKVFATGGIGGVHLDFPADVSADLPTLAETPIVVVCSGPKSILDLAATREWLETYGILTIGYRCEEMPCFYSSKSGLKVDETVDSVEEIIEIIKLRDELGIKSACLVMNPVPPEFEIDPEEQKKYLDVALRIAKEQKINGKDLTPFLLKKMSEISQNKTLQANIALLKNNAKLAAMISLELKNTSA